MDLDSDSDLNWKDSDLDSDSTTVDSTCCRVLMGVQQKKIAEHYKHCSNNHAISAAYQSPGYFTYLLKQWFALVSYSLYSVTTTMAEARIIKFAYCNVVIKDNCVTAQCVFCKTKTTISEKLGTTSNFVRHVQRKHPEK